MESEGDFRSDINSAVSRRINHARRDPVGARRELESIRAQAIGYLNDVVVGESQTAQMYSREGLCNF